MNPEGLDKNSKKVTASGNLDGLDQMPLGQKKSVTPTRFTKPAIIGQSQTSNVGASSRSVSLKRETRSSTAAQLAIVPISSEIEVKKSQAPENLTLMPAETLILRDITSQTNNEKRGRGRPRKQPTKAIEEIQVPQDIQITKEDVGEKSGADVQKISEEQYISNF